MEIGDCLKDLYGVTYKVVKYSKNYFDIEEYDQSGLGYKYYERGYKGLYVVVKGSKYFKGYYVFTYNKKLNLLEI